MNITGGTHGFDKTMKIGGQANQKQVTSLSHSRNKIFVCTLSSRRFPKSPGEVANHPRESSKQYLGSFVSAFPLGAHEKDSKFD